ncbi:DUF1475 family protein [Thioalkalivibrio sp. HK1]|uniref:DUF1475 family protein n=1 Tax=Thioalkalivibrio sp. HK1 TaxID=1469245 RepID=UPI0004720396|nr:DUF1475 family protein [Thioalkalivibrio sp. HK1]
MDSRTPPRKIDPRAEIASGFSSRNAMLFGAIVAISMALALVLAFMHAGLFADSKEILALVWGRFSVFELYISFAIVSVWILFRESHRGRAVVWIVLLMLLGHVVTGLYIARAAHRSRGDPHRFWLGGDR